MSSPPRRGRPRAETARGLSGDEQGVHLAHRSPETFLHAHADELFHLFERRESGNDVHTGAATGPLAENDPHTRRGHVGVGDTGVVGETVLHL